MQSNPEEKPAITLQALRERARELGMENMGQMGKTDLIRAIQIRQNHQPCYSQFWSAPCIDNDDCEFRNICSSNSHNGLESEEE
jgi:Rho termination factor, N-terminal domain